MKLAAKYYLHNLRNLLLIVFLISLGVALSSSLLFGIVLGTVSDSNGEGEYYVIIGFEFSFMILALVSGLVSFYEAFPFFQQNGVSRKSQFMGWTVSLLALSVVEAILAIVSSWFWGQFFLYRGMFNQLYQPLQASTNGALFLVQEFLWVCMICLFLGWAGFAIALLYYRLSKMGKILVSILVPGTLFILLPIADLSLLRGGYAWLLEKARMLLIGYLPGGIYPMVPVIGALVGSVLLAVISWLMMRRAEVKA